MFISTTVSKGFISARQHICLACYMVSPIHTSVCLSVTRVDHSKTVEVRIMQLSPQSSPIPLLQFNPEIVTAERGCQTRVGWGKRAIF